MERTPVEALRTVFELAEQNALVQREVEQDIDLYPEYQRQQQALELAQAWLASQEGDTPHDNKTA